jgi:hypothetical protein
MKAKLSILAVILLLTVAQVPVREAAAGACTFTEQATCESQCQSYHPPGCTCVGSTCTFDVNHITCNYEYFCLYGGHDPSGGGFKTLQVVHPNYEY